MMTHTYNFPPVNEHYLHYIQDKVATRNTILTQLGAYNVILCLPVTIPFYTMLKKSHFHFSVVHYGSLLWQLPNQSICINNRTSFHCLSSDTVPTSRSTFSKREIIFLNSLSNFNVPGVIHSKFFWNPELNWTWTLYSSAYSFKLGHIKTTHSHVAIR